MGDFTDNTDNTFTDISDNTIQDTEQSSDSSNTPSSDTTVSEPVDVQITPTPIVESDVPAPNEDSEHDTNNENDITNAAGVDNIHNLLADFRQDNEDYQKNVAEYQTQVLENQTYLMEQTKNILSVSSLLLLTIGFVSGILLARVVWRKL